MESSPLYPENEWYVGGSLGERVVIECEPESVDSSLLKIEIETADGQKGATKFDLATLR